VSTFTLPSGATRPRTFSELVATRPWARLVAYSVVAVAILSVSRIVADAPAMTAWPTFAATIAAAAPILLAGLGGLYSERVGVVNIGLEGMMIFGTWFAGWAGYQWGPWAAFVWGGIGGALGGLLLALATVTFGVNHVVAGFAIDILAPGVTRFLSSEFFVGVKDGSITQSPTMTGTIGSFTVPFISGGKFFGWKTPDPLGWLNRQQWFFISDLAGLLKGLTTNMAFDTLIALLLVPFTFYFLWRTATGLRMRSIGEKPDAAYSLGVSVYWLKYVGVTISGFLAGLGGAWLVIDVKAYNQGQTAGRGYQGLAALIFGNWRAVGVLGGASVFAYAQALTQQVTTAPVLALFIVAAIVFAALGARQLSKRQVWSGVIAIAVVPFLLYYYSNSTDVNNQLVYITPYLVTLIVLAFSSQRLRPPAADGLPWRKGQIG
jgi:simple sugar transport system permease protein